MPARSQTHSFSVRLARLAEVDQLPAIEISAAQSFRSVPALDWIAATDAMSPAVHRKSVQAGTCWVAVDVQDVPVGFLTAHLQGETLHILEMSVASDWQGKGIGRALIQAVKYWSIQRKITSITLTTFRDVPWNAPFYSRSGFVILEKEALDQRLASILQAEENHGFPEGSRCAMRFDVSSLAQSA